MDKAGLREDCARARFYQQRPVWSNRHVPAPPRADRDRASMSATEISRMPARAPRRRIIGLAVALLALDTAAVVGSLLLVQAAVPGTPGEGRWAAGVVFFSDFAPDGGLGPESRDRVAHAARLFLDGRVDRLICVGGRRERPRRIGARQMAEALADLGVPAERILHDRTSFDTRTNWESASGMLTAGGWGEPLLISSALHLYRIRTIAQGPFEWTPSPTRTALEALAAHPLRTIAEVHREWLAWAGTRLLAPDTHRELVRRWRNLWH
jgi:uncharacterized SAM-binding protein YcdF (DUF218 family)